MKSEIFKKIIAFTILFSTLFMGLVVLCVGWVIYCIIDLYVITLYTRRLLPAITFKNEMRVLVPILLRALSMGGVVYLLNYAVDSDILRIALGVKPRRRRPHSVGIRGSSQPETMPSSTSFLSLRFDMTV